MVKMNHWRASKLYRKPTLDWRYECDVPDRAEKWLRAVERRQLQRPQHHRGGAALARRKRVRSDGG
jgi:hypothetical protein